MAEENQNADEETNLRHGLRGAQLDFAQAVMDLYYVSNFDDIDQQILDKLADNVAKVEQAYHMAFFEYHEYQDTQELEAAPVAGTA